MHPLTTPSVNRLAVRATTHCMTGCAIGEVLGLVIGTAAGWGNTPSIAIAIALAFVFGYSLTMLPLLRSGMTFRMATRLALLADTASITLMEIVDNAIMLLIPGAMAAGLDTMVFLGQHGAIPAGCLGRGLPLESLAVSNEVGATRCSMYTTEEKNGIMTGCTLSPCP